jgi:hypothetical protein
MANAEVRLPSSVTYYLQEFYLRRLLHQQILLLGLRGKRSSVNRYAAFLISFLRRQGNIYTKLHGLLAPRAPSRDTFSIAIRMAKLQFMRLLVDMLLTRMVLWICSGGKGAYEELYRRRKHYAKPTHVRDPQNISPHSKQLGRDLQDRIATILRDHKITPVPGDFEVVNLMRKGFPETSKDTLIIRTLDGNPSIAWKNAATKVQEIVDQAASRINIKVRVEIQGSC